MTHISHFLQKPEVRRYVLQGIRLTLYLDQKIFPPSPHGAFFAKNITVHRGESVIDIGTGSGILAILAAKLGGHVTATDSDANAISLARKNAAHNKTVISFVQGKYVAGLTRKFDVLIANLPQEIVHPQYRQAIGTALDRTISGGAAGNRQLLHFLKIAKQHMHRTSRLYIIVNTLNNYAHTLRYITSHYKVRLVNFSSEPTKEFVTDHSDWYLSLLQRGVITIFLRSGRWHAHEYLFELQMP